MFKRTLSIAISAVILAGCNTAVVKTPVAQNEVKPANELSGVDLKNAAASELKKMFNSGQAIDRGLDEYEVIYRAVMHNLDSRLRRLDTTFSNEMLVVDNLSVLPALANNAGYSSGQVFGDTDQTSAYQVSSGFDVNSSNLAATWNILDMSMGYFASKQAGDVSEINTERQRRAGMDIVRHAKEAYWRAFAAQQLSERVQQNLDMAQSSLSKIQKSLSAGELTSIEALKQRKSVIESIRQLEELKQELDFAALNLSRIVNARPGEEIKVKKSPMTSLDVTDTLEVLERRAYAQSPEIRESKTRENFSIDEVKKVSTFLFPSLSSTASLQTSGEARPSSEWSQYGLNVGWNLIKLANETGDESTDIETDEAKALALRIALLAKTHIGFEAYRTSKQQFNQANELYEIESLIAEQSRKRKGDSLASEVESILTETSAILAERQMYDSYARLVSAYETLQGTVGNDSELVSVINERNKRLADAQMALAKAEEDISRAEASITNIDAESLALRQELTSLSMSLNNTVAELVTSRSQHESAKQALELASQRVKTSSEAVSKLDDIIASQNQEVAAARDEVSRIKTVLVTEDSAVKFDEQNLAGLNSDRQSAVQQLLALNERESQIFAAKLSENQDVMVEDIRQVTADREKITAKMETLNGQIKSAQDSLINSQKRKSEVENQLSSAAAVEAGLVAKLNLLTSQRVTEKQKADLARDQLDSAKNELIRLSKAVQDSESKVETTKARQEKIRTAIATLVESKARSLEDKLKAKQAYDNAKDSLVFLVGNKP